MTQSSAVCRIAVWMAWLSRSAASTWRRFRNWPTCCPSAASVSRPSSAVSDAPAPEKGPARHPGDGGLAPIGDAPGDYVRIKS